MATQFATLKADTLAAGNIQAWAGFIENTLVGGGWVVTADTGQTLPSALAAAAGTPSRSGYRIYRMGDALQATAPVFMRLDFGSAQFGGGGDPGLWITIGTGSDGIGNITGKMYDGGAAVNITTGSSGRDPAVGYNCYGSASAGRMTIGMFAAQEASGNLPFAFGIERTKDLAGNDTGAGLLLLNGGSAIGGGLHTSAYLIYGALPGAQPAAEVGISYVISSRMPSETFAPGDIGVGVIIHFKGVSQQPGVNFVMSNSSDVPLGGMINTTIYGVTHTYVQLGFYLNGFKRAGSSGTQEGSARSLMRFD